MYDREKDRGCTEREEGGQRGRGYREGGREGEREREGREGGRGVRERKREKERAGECHCMRLARFMSP